MQIIQTSYNFISDAPEKCIITKSCTATVDVRLLHHNNDDYNNDDDDDVDAAIAANNLAFNASTHYQLIN